MTYSINGSFIFDKVRSENVVCSSGVVPIVGYTTQASKQVADNSTGPSVTITIRGTWTGTLASINSSYITNWVDLTAPTGTSIGLANNLQTTYYSYVSDALNPSGTPEIKVKIISVDFTINGGEVSSVDYTVVLFYGGQ